MPKTRLILAALASAMCFSTPALAATVDSGLQAQVSAKISTSLLSPLNAFTPASSLAQAALPTQLPIGALATAQAHTDDATDDVAEAGGNQLSQLIDLAMQLRNTRYVRGGRDPSTGFDCSGFVRYVFEHAIGLQLPTNSASQYLVGHMVARKDMQPGDLVFFRTAGGRRGQGRVSHVGIYISDGHFIHSPRRGESVRVDSLTDSYWSKRFAGARRPEAMASVESGLHSG